ncbi:transglycosylase SLT domain-containing protein [Rhodococcus hoagii]|nr:transglycosylase SLT domain-containing protein [Prescottella equi]
MKNWTTAAAIVGAAIASTALVSCGDSDTDGTELARGPVTVPAEYRPWVAKAGSTCDAITPALIAAQIEQQSAWDARATSTAGAQGLSQLLPQTWDTFGIDADGNGVASPLDPADAIMTLAAVDCDSRRVQRRTRPLG